MWAWWWLEDGDRWGFGGGLRTASPACELAAPRLPLRITRMPEAAIPCRVRLQGACRASAGRGSWRACEGGRQVRMDAAAPSSHPLACTSTITPKSPAQGALLRLQNLCSAVQNCGWRLV